MTTGSDPEVFMCGLAGFISRKTIRPDVAHAIADAMADAIEHRGPDDGGVWVGGGDAVEIALAHRRLSIVDLTPSGHQPMVSISGRYVLVYNGEIYNSDQLRQQLDWRQWNGSSDTETILVAIEKWGLVRTLRESVGMFALALWDVEENRLSLARDRMGEKPLYYGWQGDSFLFSSELKALKIHPDFVGEVSRTALQKYLHRGTVPGPYSIYENIFKLDAGTILSLDLHTAQICEPEIERYWSLDEIIMGRLSHPSEGYDPKYAALECALMQSVGGQMVADVPVGAFLSGGIDSSLIVSLMQARSRTPVKTFTIGFEESNYDEAKHAAIIAKHLGTDHAQLYISAEASMRVIPNLPTVFDEPFGDASQIPTILLSKLAKENVKVSLSGDGGDELFCGYSRYFSLNRVWRKISILPRPVRLSLSKLILELDKSNRLNRYTLDRISRFALSLQVNSANEFYRVNTNQWQEAASMVRSDGRVIESALYRERGPNLSSFVEQMMYDDTRGYMCDDILVKVDRAAMSVGLESRIPLLDHRVVEAAWNMPISFKTRDGVGKWPLRQILYKHVPRELVDRPKKGFSVPVDEWLRGPLREWAEELIAENRLEAEGFFHPEPIRRKWKEHLSGKYNWRDPLWAILMFQAWWEAEMNGFETLAYRHKRAIV